MAHRIVFTNTQVYTDTRFYRNLQMEQKAPVNKIGLVSIQDH